MTEQRRIADLTRVGGSARRAVAASTLAALVAATAASASARAASSPLRLTVYSVANAEQFLRYSDDRQRGYGNNPFGNFKDTTATVNRHKNGPLPGDIDDFQFSVYKAANLKQRIGTARITCQYNFNLHAFCDATYLLTDGTLAGAGSIDFKAASFTISITGGSGKYVGRRGELRSTPAAHRAQRLVFDLT